MPIIVKDVTMSSSATSGGIEMDGSASQNPSAALRNKLPEDLGCLVKLLKLNPLVHRVGLVDAARAENHGGDIP